MSRRPHPPRAGAPARPEQEEAPGSLFDLEQAASCTECTGLLPTPVENDDQGESVAALQGIHKIRPMERENKKQ